uniref:ZP domain-containing protein n=1 Tax=Syphacia muris TaxID=451379 RepID=A0A0N5API1_9BILA
MRTDSATDRITSLFDVLFVFIGICILSASSVNTDDGGNWAVKDDDGTYCMKMKAKITLLLNYIDDDKKTMRDIPVNVPRTATSDGSSCDLVEVHIKNDEIIPMQILRLTFDKEKHPGWYVEFYFTQGRFTAHENSFVLCAAVISANYSTMPDLFPNCGDNSAYIYNPLQLTELNGRLPEIAAIIYSRKGRSFYCQDKKEIKLIDNETVGLPAKLKIQDLQVEAFMTKKENVFDKKSICPADQTDNDLLPIVVGCILAALIILTLGSYLASFQNYILLQA